MKLRIIAAALAFMLCTAAYAEAKEMRIGYANLLKALSESEAAKKADAAFNDEAKKLEDQLTKRQEELAKMQKEYDEKGSLWNKETFDKKEAEYKARAQEFQKMNAQYEDLNRKRNEKKDVIIRELVEVSEKVAKEKGYTHVFEQSAGGLIYAPKEDEITDDVVKEHNKRYKSKGN